jgi:Flp pilus assembly protein TadD
MTQLKQAVKLAPDRATFLSNLGYAETLAGQLEQATRTLRKAVEKDARLGSAWINLGIVLSKQGQYDEADRCFGKALELDPADPRALANREELRAMRGQRSGEPSTKPGSK